MQRREQGTTTVRLAKCEGSYRPPSRRLAIQLKGAPHRPSRVTLNGTELTPGEKPNEWTYDAAGRSVRLFLTDSPEAITLLVQD